MPIADWPMEELLQPINDSLAHRIAERIRCLDDYFDAAAHGVELFSARAGYRPQAIEPSMLGNDL